MAVSLIYDGGYDEHLESAAPLLDFLELRATFFVNPPKVLKALSSWQNLAQRGHEIGNGCLHGVTLNGELPKWTLRTVEQDLYMTQNFLREMFPEQSPDSFLYEGTSTDCAQGSYRELIDAEFPFSVQETQGLRLRDMDTDDHFGSIVSPDVDLENLTAPWTGVRIQRIGAAEGEITLQAHERFLRLLATCSNWWIASVGDVGRYLRAEFEK